MLGIGRSLKIKMALIFGSIVVFSLIASGVLTFVHTRKTLMDRISCELASGIKRKGHEVVEFLKDRVTDVELIANSRYPMDIINYVLKVREGVTGSIAIYEGLAHKAHDYLKNPKVRKYFDDIVIIDSESFYIFYTVQRGLEGGFIPVSQYEVLRSAWGAVVEDRPEYRNGAADHKTVYISDITFYQPVGQPCLIIACPITNDLGRRVAVIVGVVGIRHINLVVAGEAGQGKASETYLVGRDGLVRSSTVFLSINDVGQKKIESEALQRALKGEEGVVTCVNHRNQKVVTAFAPLKLPDRAGTNFDWIILSEVEYDRAFGPVRRLAFYYSFLGIGIALLAVVVSFFVARSMVRPIRVLRDAVGAMAKGDLSYALPDSKRGDEVGELIRDFRKMQEVLKANTGGLVEGVQRLATAVNELSATAAELATGAAETASSVQEVGTTAEEMRQVARHSLEKSRNVGAIAEDAVREAVRGREAAEEALKGLGSIRREIEFLASSVIKLGEQSRNIGIIIDTVKDLADQVNILSVNAAIEAARAGEQGKGFSVVAQEMRNLAEQSREAADRIKEILTKVQDSTSEAVMAVERGNKAVSRGVELGEEMGSTIKSLAAVVQEAADSALQISASSQQQLTGVEQVVEAMRAIQEAVHQNTEAARQLEASVHDLAELSESLKKLAESFKF
ncbi:methyl-accepting chemotaxis protein [Thermodesulforhabdus norvegica]|uniref:Methyl-accepting chemotaxis protein n=1 Tax=Thermodesulforhabdus norvegica TaxID=39841 RepID=A0A1I4UV46_9BACT|nr:methyl-accepting chemotaxis protein [Thermodesulforhabdus norvegica]SFM92623.1 methyl-accepting chemotaxis protein [Thermodesulforhabdus norvegica]